MDGREGLRSLMADFLLELLSEEIPARMQAKARNDLSRLFAESTAAAGRLAATRITLRSIGVRGLRKGEQTAW